MPWQQDVLDVSLEFDPVTLEFAYRQVVLTIPRQNGKTTLLLVLILLRALGWVRQSIKYTAQTGSDARQKWMDDWLPMLQETSFRAFYRPRLTNGHEALIFKNGSRQGLVATTMKSGHGGSVDLVVLDEAFAHPDARLEQALLPAQVTRWSPQFWVVSTAGTFVQSPYLWAKVDAGRQLVEAGAQSGVAYFEWTVPESMDPEDPATWWACNPAMGITITEEAVRAELEEAKNGEGGINEFRRFRLNQWTVERTDPVIPLATWDGLEDKTVGRVGGCAFALDTSPDRAHTSITVASDVGDGQILVEVLENAEGTDWAAAKVEKLHEKNPEAPVVMDPASPAASLIPDLEKRGVVVTTTDSQQMARACGFLYDAAKDGNLRHRGSSLLRLALEGARKRPLGDAWAWSRKNSSVDISPLVAVTLATWGLQTLPEVEYAHVVFVGDSDTESKQEDEQPTYGPKIRVRDQDDHPKDCACLKCRYKGGK
jgi:phage terminase large subunit-like protein